MKMALGLAALALLQLACAVWLLCWAVGFDPPVLGNGIHHATQQLQTLAARYPDDFRPVAATGDHLRWFFARSIDSLFVASGAGLVLLLSAAASGFVAIRLRRIPVTRSEGRD